ncbi:MAG: kinase/pyrophosphorylase [Clostridia bacterium]|nr:kinase/pyrophosphorylase [Clostridia bacterium]
MATIYAISDSLGETAELVGRAAASQFDGQQVEIRRIPFVSKDEYLEQVIREAGRGPSVIVYTIVMKELEDHLLYLAKKYNVPAVNVLGQALDVISKITKTNPKKKPGLLRKMDEQYHRKVEAVEFAVKYDDGKDPQGIKFSEIVLVGVSRTSKTPVCMYLANKRIKAANIPLIPEVSPPGELFELPKHRVMGLTISLRRLYEIRQARLVTLGLMPGADYASHQRILKELEYAEAVMKKIGCPIIDVTNRAVEETASKVLEYYYKGERHGK